MSKILCVYHDGASKVIDGHGPPWSAHNKTVVPLPAALQHAPESLECEERVFKLRQFIVEVYVEEGAGDGQAEQAVFSRLGVSR